VTQLKKGVKVPETEIIAEANAWIEPDFSVVEHPLRVLDQKERQTRRHTVKMYKIQWSHHTKEKATSEIEQFPNTKYPGFLQSQNSENLTLPLSLISESRDEIPLRGVGCNTPGV
jgi:hypothetical protein